MQDDKALDAIWSKIRRTILSKSVLTGEQLLTRERNGKDPEGADDDWGMIVVLGYGVDKEMKKHLTEKEAQDVEAAMKEVVLAPRSDKPQWFRVRRLW